MAAESSILRNLGKQLDERTMHGVKHSVAFACVIMYVILLLFDVLWLALQCGKRPKSP